MNKLTKYSVNKLIFLIKKIYSLLRWMEIKKLYFKS